MRVAHARLMLLGVVPASSRIVPSDRGSTSPDGKQEEAGVDGDEDEARAEARGGLDGTGDHQPEHEEQGTGHGDSSARRVHPATPQELWSVA